MILQAPRLALREMTDADLPALRVIFEDPVAMAAYEGPFDDAESADWVARQQQRYADDGFGLWAVELSGTGRVIGQCGITRQHLDDEASAEEVIEVGYLFQREHWHHGYAVEAASACRDWAFETLEINKLYAKVRDTNIASMNVAIRLGMTVRRRFVTHYRGADMPHLAFAITRAEWTARVGPAPLPQEPRRADEPAQ
ncbi:MAG: GNAT family N-acetyltransferase [Microbacterium sp.]